MTLGKVQEEDIELKEDPWAVILVLQEYFIHHDDFSTGELPLAS
jgi:hypothetical protein